MSSMAPQKKFDAGNKLISFWPVGNSGKLLAGKAIQTEKGGAVIDLTKRALLEAVKAMTVKDDAPLEALIIVNVDRDNDRYPLQTLYFKERQQFESKGRVNRPKADDAEDDDIPF
jgi:aminopeptidase-like protein